MKLGDYELGPQVGSGGMGSVHLAHEATTRSPVALKRIHTQYADEKTTLRRFAIEIQTASRLRHPNIVAVIDSGTEPRGTPYCVMEWVSGMPLGRWSRAKLPWEQIAWIMGDLLSALAYAHARGVVHRDLKPANILIENPFDESPQLKLVDFGIARILEPEDDIGAVTALTLQDRVLGTPAYLSPEQAQGFTHLIGPHTDIYSAGIILYELITGRLPFRQDSVVGLLTAHATKQAPPIDLSNRPDVPREVIAVLRTMLDKSPDSRARSATAIRDSLGLMTNPGRRALPRIDTMDGADDVTEELSPTLVDTRSDVLMPTLDERTPATIERRWTHEPPMMLGRDKEYERLLHLAEAVLKDRRSRLVFVHGEAGLGKSRLAQEVRYHYEEMGVFRGARLYCRSSGAEGSAVGALLARLLMAERLSGRALERRIDEIAPLFDLTPIHCRALNAWLSDEPDEPAGTDDRIELAAELLRRAASRGPLCLILEGADDESSRFTLAVLENLFGDMGTNALLFVLATSRKSPSELSGAMGELYELLSAEGRAFEVGLGPLQEDVLADLLRPVVPDQARHIAARSQGNPLFAIELARLRSGQFTEEVAITLPASMGGVWERRLQSATSEASYPGLAKAVLVATALLGPRVKKRRLLSLISRACKVEDETAELALLPWLENSVLVDDGSREALISFVHDAASDYVREKPEAGIPEVANVLSTLASDVLIERGGMDPDSLLLVVENLPGNDPSRRRSLRLFAGELFIGRFEYDRAHEQFNSVLDEAGGDETGLIGALHSARLYILQGELVPASGLLEEVERTVASREDPQLTIRLELLRVKSDLAIARGQYQPAAKLLSEAVSFAEKVAGVIRLTEVRIQLSRALDRAGDMSSAERHIRIAIKTLKASDTPNRVLASAYVSLASLCRRQGRHAEAIEAVDIALPLAEAAGARVQVDRILDVKLELAADAGDYETAVELGGRLLDQRVTAGDTEGIARAQYALAVVERGRGHLTDARSYHQQSLENMTNASEPTLAAANYRDLGLTFLEAKRPDLASEHLTTAAERYRQAGDAAKAAEAKVLLARVLISSNRPVKAERLAQEALTAQIRLNDMLGQARNDHVQGLICVNRTQWDSARGHFADARNSFATMGVYSDQIVSETWLALSESELGLHPTPEMAARDIVERLRERPVFSRDLVEGLERLGASLTVRDRELAQRLQDRARHLEDRFKWKL